MMRRAETGGVGGRAVRERLRQPTLNAVKAFEAAARLGSLKAAAEALGVTSSAVSHQIRQLEGEIGKRLFIRRNNAIELTPEGHQLFEQVGPSLRTIARATEAIRIDTKVVALNVTNAFALVWLIPRLADFQKRYPRIAIDMDTVRLPIVLDDSMEMTISYARAQPVSGAIELVKDLEIPMAASGLWQDRRGRSRDLGAVPLISSTADDWDWRVWAVEHNIEFAQLRVAYRFDSGLAAVGACRAGLGVALLPTNFGLPEVESGLLVPFGTFRELYFGGWWLATASRLRRPAQIFRDWLLKVAPGVQPNYRLDGAVVPAANGAALRK
jgi:LysR family transcriptional regulator, glycine cleavage system transcriptional activator